MRANTPPHTPNTAAVFLSPASLCARWKVSDMTLRRWRKDGRLHALHLGRQVRFSLSEVERFEAEAKD